MAVVQDTIRAWNAFVLVVDQDPALGLGTRAGLNSIAVDPTGLWYQKTGPLDTNWALIVIPTGGNVLDNYGSFYSTAIQLSGGVTAENLMTFNQTPISNGVSIVNNSEVTFVRGGVYNIQFSAQVTKTGGGPANFDVWLKKNGANVPWTNTTIEIQGSNQEVVAAWNFFETLGNGEFIQLAWCSNDATMRLLSQGPQINPVRPEIPSVILTVDQVSS